MNKISIITPSFNQGQYIRQTISSVVNQDYENKEYLIIDGGSTDNTIEVIKEHSNRIQYWVSETDTGQSNAINKGLLKSCGDILAWINSDDYYEDNIFQIISDYFKQNPNIDLLYFDVNNLFPSNTRIHHHRHEYFPEHFLTKVCLHQPGVFWRRRIMEKVGFLDENLHFVMDFDLWIRIYLNANIKYIPKIISNFRIHSESKTNNNPVQLYLEKNQVIAELFYNLQRTKYLDKLHSLALVPDSTFKNYSVSKKLSEKEIHQVYTRHIINNAFLYFRMNNFAQSKKILDELSNCKTDIHIQAAVLKMKLILAKLKDRF